MKDSYSFDLDDDAFMHSYQAHRDAYIKTFDRLGLPVVIVAAMSGAMGGSASEEFLAPAEVGEDTYVRCTACDYAANVEAVRVPVPEAVAYDTSHPATVVDTPNTPTIQTLVDHLNEHGFDRAGGGLWTAADTMKNVIVTLRHPDGSTEPLAIGVPGDRDVDEKRLQAQVEPAAVEAFDEADFAKHSALVKGYIGPGTLGSAGTSGIRLLVDPRIVDGTRWVTGANEPGKHVIDLTYGRDFTADGVIEAAEVRAGDVCPSCGGTIEIARGIEMGHIFQLGRKYSEALGLTVQDESGKRITPTMGSYGIGVSRAVAALAEANHDELGLCWPREVSPADVHLVIAGKEGGLQRPAAEELAAEMEAAGLRVLFDDREGVSPGVRFKDAELIGVPTIVVVGRGIADGLVEVKDRRTGERQDLPVGDVVGHLLTPA